jgi:hypothetical protein
VGQLCRTKKIDARRVGRAWFVNLDSLTAHKQNRHTTKPSKQPAEMVTATTAEVREVAVEATEAPVTTPAAQKREVYPLIKTKTLRQLSEQSVTTTPDTKNLRVSYEPDDGYLMPELHREPRSEPEILKVTPAEAKTVRIRGQKKQTVFQAGELPSVSLAGNLEVEAVAEATEETPEAPNDPMVTNTTDIRDSFKNKAKTEGDIEREPAPADSKKKTTVITPDQPVVAMTKKKDEKAAKKAAKSGVAQKKVPTEINLKGKTAETHVSSVPMSMLVRLSPLLMTLVAVACVAMLFSASSDILVTAAGYESTVVLQVANLLEVINP